jgi:amino acid transporter
MAEERHGLQGDSSQDAASDSSADGAHGERSSPDSARPDSQRVRVPRQGAPPPDALRADPPRPDPQEQRPRGIDLNYHEVVQGHRAGGQYVRIPRTVGGFRRRSAGTIEATSEATRPTTPFGLIIAGVKRTVIGEALATRELAHERLSKVKALAVFSSDALSSSAYATEEILLVLILAGTMAISYTMPISLAIATLLAIVAFSYRQTIRAYPQGGGSYIVSKDNLGTWPSLVAGGALLIGYILTVSVSISAGVAAIASAVPALDSHRVPLALGFIALITVLNLRGVRESGTIFAIPTYAFITAMGAMIGVGVVRFFTGTLEPVPPPADALPAATEALSAFLILRAFSSGCAALTGTEAISDGVPAFKPPEWKNAQITLTWMAITLATLFLGISFLANQLMIIPHGHETVVSQIARAVFGDTALYYAIQIATMLGLVLAANTVYSDFPRLAYFLARDHFLPHQFQFRGDRLAFSSGIIALGVVAGLIVFQFRANTHALIPLYAIGVFIAFTLSESSMVRHWWVNREQGWQRSFVINGIGAIATGLVAIVIGVTKFAEGAWMVLVVIPIFGLIMRFINAHYVSVADQLALESTEEHPTPVPRPIVLVPVPGINRAVKRTIEVAAGLSDHATAVHVTDDREAGERLRERWELWAPHVPLIILESPYRAFAGPLLAYINSIQRHDAATPIVVVLSEFVPHHFWEYALHNQTALRLKLALFFRPNTVVMDVPYHLAR